jgi:hypothetical protein
MIWKTARFERKRLCAIKQKKSVNNKNDKNPVGEKQRDFFAMKPVVCNNKPANDLITYRDEQRYYILTLEQDLLGAWRIVKMNGRIGTRLGSTHIELVESYESGLVRFNKLYDYRVRSRHYTVV